MKRLAAISLLCLAASLPPMPRLKPVLRSPKDASNQPSVVIKPAVTAPPVMQQITLVWDYPTNLLAGVQFEVWAATAVIQGPPLTNATNVPTGFSLLIVVDAPPAVIQSNLPQQFFIVRAKDRATGAYSKWNQLVSNGPVMLDSPEHGQVVSNTITLIATINLPLNAPWSPGRLELSL